MQDLEGLAEVLKLANFFVTVIFDSPNVSKQVCKYPELFRKSFRKLFRKSFHDSLILYLYNTIYILYDISILY